MGCHLEPLQTVADHREQGNDEGQRQSPEEAAQEVLANKATPSLVFMFNNLDGPARLIDVLGRERVLLGFRGAAGERLASG